MKQTKKSISTKTVETKLTQLTKLVQRKKDLEARIESIKQSLKTKMKNLGLSRLDGETLYCYYSTVHRQIVDTDKLKAYDLFDKYSKDINYEVFNYNVIK